MNCEIRADVTATAKVDNTGWTIAYSYYLIATNALGYPFQNGGNSSGNIDIEGSRKHTFSSTYAFPNPHASGYVLPLGSGSYDKPVTPLGTGSVAVAFAFSGYSGTPLSTGGTSGSLTLPPILLGPKIKATTFKSGTWKTKQSTMKALVLKTQQGGTWKSLV